jgi:hypothetical protein
MANNPAIVPDIEARWRPLSEQEARTAQALLDDLWARALTQVPTLSANLDAGSLSTEVVKSVMAGAVLRVLRNPEGKASEQIDDYKYTRDAAISTGGLYLSPDELILLGKARARAVSMSVSPRFGGPTWG